MLIACIYLPNGNPQPGPKFDYKLAWFERLIAHAATLFATDAPVILGGRLQRRADRLRYLQRRDHGQERLTPARPRACYRRMLEQGWIDALRTLHPENPMYTFWDYMRKRWPA